MYDNVYFLILENYLTTKQFNMTSILQNGRNQSVRLSYLPNTTLSPQIRCMFPLEPEFAYTSIVMAVFIIVLNTFALVLFFTRKVLQRLAGNLILASLSLNDLLNGLYILFNLFPRLYLHHNNCMENQLLFRQIEFATIGRTIYRALMLSSVAHLVLLSSDRLLYVVYALTYNSIVTKRKMVKTLVIIWLSCFLCSGVQLTWSLMDGPLNSDRKQLKPYHTAILTVLFIGLPSLILLVQSVTMVIMVRKLDISRNSHCMAGKKAFILYICMYVKFMLFTYPYFIFTLIYEVNGHAYWEKNIPLVVVRISLITRFLPCLINPCLYSLQNKDYRGVIKVTFKKIQKTRAKSFKLDSKGFNKRGSRHLVNMDHNRNETEDSRML